MYKYTKSSELDFAASWNPDKLELNKLEIQISWNSGKLEIQKIQSQKSWKIVASQRAKT
jgi:hypothetical protein